MNITLKLFSYFTKYLRPDAINQAMELQVQKDIKISAVLEDLNVPLDECRLIIINGVVRTDTKAALDTIIQEGDTVAVLPNVH